MQSAGEVGGLLMVLDGVATGGGPNSTDDPADDGRWDFSVFAKAYGNGNIRICHLA